MENAIEIPSVLYPVNLGTRLRAGSLSSRQIGACAFSIPPCPAVSVSEVRRTDYIGPWISEAHSRCVMTLKAMHMESRGQGSGVFKSRASEVARMAVYIQPLSSSTRLKAHQSLWTLYPLSIAPVRLKPGTQVRQAFGLLVASACLTGARGTHVPPILTTPGGWRCNLRAARYSAS